MAARDHSRGQSFGHSSAHTLSKGGGYPPLPPDPEPDDEDYLLGADGQYLVGADREFLTGLEADA